MFALTKIEGKLTGKRVLFLKTFLENRARLDGATVDYEVLMQECCQACIANGEDQIGFPDATIQNHNHKDAVKKALKSLEGAGVFTQSGGVVTIKGSIVENPGDVSCDF